MSRHALQLVGVLVGFLALPLGAAAQEVGRQRSVVDSLSRELARAERELEALGRPAAGRHDTLRVGALTVLTPTDRVAITLAGMELAWARLTEHLGPAAEGLARDTLQVRLLQPGIPMLSGAHAALAIRDDATAQVIAARIHEIAADVIFGDDDSIRVWLSHHVPFAQDGRTLAGETYRQLATSLSVAAERCYLGDLAWCREALGLVSTDDPAQRWYDAGGRRALVNLYHDSFRYRTGSWADPMIEQCTDQRSDAACSALLADLPRYVVIPAALDVAARQQLLVTALSRGGVGAIERFRTTRGSLEQRLVAAADEPSDSLFKAWRARVLAAAPPPPVVTREARWMVLVWIGIFTAVAVGMTRWS